MIKLSISNGTIVWISLVPATIFLFLFTLTFKLRNSKNFKIIKELSVLIYVTHGLFLNLIPKKFNGFYLNNLFRFLVVFLCSFILSSIIRALSKNKKFEILLLK